MLVLGGASIVYGDQNRVFYGTDNEGISCSAARGKYITFPRLSQDLAISLSGSFDITDSTALAESITNFKLFGVCVDSCPAANAQVCTASIAANITASHPGAEQAYVEAAYAAYWANGYGTGGLSDETVRVLTHCYLTPVRTKNYFFRCFPEFDSDIVTTKVCANPAGIAADDPACITQTETVISEVTKVGRAARLSIVYRRCYLELHFICYISCEPLCSLFLFLTLF